MTNGRESDAKRHFVVTWLPWVLGLAALGLYLFTLNRSISFLPEWSTVLGLPSAPAGARLAGWSWLPEFLSPGYYLATLPLRWLPTRLIPVATNLFSAVCAALALIQLARSVALLPHDRTRDQRERVEGRHSLLTFSLSWAPPVFAVLVCALGLGFWEHGTNGTVEMFDLLLFSYVVRALLEYRLDAKEGRLYRAAFVFGVGMTGNAAMIGFFPLFVVALVWSRQLGFFNLRFLGWMALCGLAGLSFYLLLPVIGTFAQDQTASFWELLKLNLLAEKSVLAVFPKKTLLLFSLTSVLPVILLSVRWASQFGDPSRLGAILTTFLFHVCHVVVLLACLWAALDPEFSPRKAGLGFAFLPLYYLGALSVGYYSGYLLLISRAIATRQRPATPLAGAIQHTATLFILALLILTPAALIYRNLPQIRLSNGPLQSEFAADVARGLPQSGVILSDDPRRLWIIQEWLARNNRSADFIALCSQWLKLPQYHSYLKQRNPDWNPPATDEKTKLATDVALVDLMQKLSRNKTICYLHPSFGYYFESFRGQPHGLTQHLIPYSDSQLVASPVSPELITWNDEFWSKTGDRLKSTLLPATVLPEENRRLPFPENVFESIRLKPERNRQALECGAIYSRSLVNWGVELQRAGEYEKSADYFALAKDLNPDNVVAEINLEFNRKFRSGQTTPVEITKSVEDRFGKYRSWEEVLTQNGPYDEPSLTYAQGYVFIQGNLLRQAAQEFNRVRALSTNDLASRLWLAQLNLNRGFPDETLALAREIRECAQRVPGATTNITDLFTLEASAYFAKKEPETASKLIESNLEMNPGNFQLLAAACKTYSDNGQYTNALDITERMLAIDPENGSCWLNKGCFLVELNQYDKAITSFDRVLGIETNNYTAILYRAIANLRSDKLDEARVDYEYIQRQYPKLHQVDYGLGEIAYRRKDTNAAIRHYESYLSNAPPQYAEAKLVAERIQELQGDKPK